MYKINKNCISDFSVKVPIVALATKSKLFDTSFSVTSELILFNYKTKQEQIYKSEHRFCKIKWCETDSSYLAAGHENGFISVYKLDKIEENNEYTLKLLFIKQHPKSSDDIIDLDFLSNKGMLAVLSQNGKIFFININDQKEYFVDVIIENPVCMAWNYKVNKILAVGTNNGLIKLIDIKKNTVIMTISDYNKIKKICWDTSIPTKLIIQSDKKYLTEHELSNDCKNELEEYLDDIVTFHDQFIVTTKEVINTINKTIFKFETPINSCTLYKNIVVYNNKNGTTGVIYIPVMKEKRPHFRFENKIYTNNKIYVIKNKRNISNYTLDNESVDNFYNQLRESQYPSTFLLNNAHSINKVYVKHRINPIHVDLNNKIHQELINGNFAILQDSQETIPLKYLLSLLEKNPEVLNTISNFESFMLFSKLHDNFSFLYRIDNSRILAAILINLNLDLNILTNTDKEGKIIKGILTNDDSIISDRLILGNNYYKNMFTIEKMLGNLEKPIESDYLSEFFWYKQSIGEYEAVKDLKVQDIKIIQYKNAISSTTSIDLNNFSRDYNKTDLNNKLNKTTLSSHSSNIFKSNISNNTDLTANSSQTMPNLNMNYNIKKPMSLNNPPSSIGIKPGIKSPFAPKSPGIITKPMENLHSSQNINSTTITRNQQIPIPSSLKPGLRTPSLAHRPMGIRETNPIGDRFQSPNRVMMRNPLHPNVPTMGIPGINDSRKIPDPINNINPQQNNQINRQRIFEEFDMLINQVKQKAEQKNSILLNQKKQRFLNGLTAYNNIDRQTTDIEILLQMDKLIQRMKQPDHRLKIDLDGMNLHSTVWMQSLIELIKIGY